MKKDFILTEQHGTFKPFWHLFYWTNINSNFLIFLFLFFAARTVLFIIPFCPCCISGLIHVFRLVRLVIEIFFFTLLHLADFYSCYCNFPFFLCFTHDHLRFQKGKNLPLYFLSSYTSLLSILSVSWRIDRHTFSCSFFFSNTEIHSSKICF